MALSTKMKRRTYLLSMLLVWTISFSSLAKNTEEITIIEDISIPSKLDIPIINNEMSNIEKCEKFDKSIKQILNRWKVAGASLAIMKNNKLIYAKGYGYADKEQHIKCEPYNKFRIASMSKLITATAIMKLIDNGSISLKSKVFGEKGILTSQYPTYKDPRVKLITIEHLLRHEGGFTTPIGDPLFKIQLVELGLGITRPITTKNTIDYALSRKLGYRPGDHKKYSNIGYLLLSEVIQVVSGESYENYIKNKILIPSGCYDTHLANNQYKHRFPNEVKYYSDIKNDVIKSYNGSGEILPKAYGGNNIRALKGAGAWVSTSSDMLRFALAIDGNNDKDGIKDVISKESVLILQKNVKQRLPIGWASVRGGVLERTGSFSGTSAIMRFQEGDYSWIMLTNTSSWIGPKLNNRIKSAVRANLGSFPKMETDRNLFNREYINKLISQPLKNN